MRYHRVLCCIKAKVWYTKYWHCLLLLLLYYYFYWHFYKLITVYYSSLILYALPCPWPHAVFKLWIVSSHSLFVSSTPCRAHVIVFAICRSGRLDEPDGNRSKWRGSGRDSPADLAWGGRRHATQTAMSSSGGQVSFKRFNWADCKQKSCALKKKACYLKSKSKSCLMYVLVLEMDMLRIWSEWTNLHVALFLFSRDLAKKDRNGASDPFVRVRYNGKTYESAVSITLHYGYLADALIQSGIVPD